MANQEHLEILKQGLEKWNAWRNAYPEIRPDLYSSGLLIVDLSNLDLSGFNLSNSDLIGTNISNSNLSHTNLRAANLLSANLTKTNLYAANLSEAYLGKANLCGTDLREADLDAANFNEAILSNTELRAAKNLSKADFSEAHFNFIDLNKADLAKTTLDFARFSNSDLSGANLSKASLCGTQLSESNLCRTDLREAFLSAAHLNDVDLIGADLANVTLRGANLLRVDLSEANLSSADLSGATLLEINLTRTILKNCRVYNTSIWKVQFEETIQENLITTDDNQPVITVDHLKIAQFICLLAETQEIQEMLNPLATRSVLILGNFAARRVIVSHTLKETLRKQNYQPLTLDTALFSSPKIGEIIRSLARLSCFVLLDLTGMSNLSELIKEAIPTFAVPVQILVETTRAEDYRLFSNSLVSPWILPFYQYSDVEELQENAIEKFITPAVKKCKN